MPMQLQSITILTFAAQKKYEIGLEMYLVGNVSSGYFWFLCELGVFQPNCYFLDFGEALKPWKPSGVKPLKGI